MVLAPATAEPTSDLLRPAQGLLTFKVCATEHQGRILRIRSPKCTIGSDPSCTLRLRAEGIRPFHCLVLRGRNGMLLRRWSGETCLNGASFTDAWIKPGDRISIGPIELELLDSSATTAATPQPAPAGSQPGPRQIPANGGFSAENNVPENSALDLLRQELAELKQRQLSEQESLLGRAAAAENQLSELRSELRAMRQTSESLQSQRQTDQSNELERRREQLRTAQQELERQRAEAAKWQAEAERADGELDDTRSELESLQKTHSSTQNRREAAQQELEQLQAELQTAQSQLQEARQQTTAIEQRQEATQRELEGLQKELDSLKETLDSQQAAQQDDRKELEATRQQLESAREDLQKSHQSADERVQDLANQRDTFRQECESSRRELEDVQREHSEARGRLETLEQQQKSDQEELEAARLELQQLREQSEQERQQQREHLEKLSLQLDEVGERLLASEDWAAQLQTQLEQARRQLEEASPDDQSADEASPGDQQFAAVQQQLDAETQRWEHEREEWQRAEQELRDQLKQATEDLNKATQSLEESRCRSEELQSQLDETSQRLAQRDEVDNEKSPDRQDGTEELARYREQAENARQEVQQQRAEHQRVRNEWHIERESLLSELAERSQALEELQATHEEKMQQAEFLITSLQQEGKQLLVQVDEMKQQLRREADEQTSSSEGANLARFSQTLLMPGRTGKKKDQSEGTKLAPDAAAPNRSVTEPLSAVSSDISTAAIGTSEDDEDAEPKTDGANEPADQDSPIDVCGTMVMTRPSCDEQAGQVEPADDELVDDASGTMMLDAEQLQEQARVEAEHEGYVAGQQAAVSQDEVDSDDDEGAIQNYMERLLKRVASGGREEEPAHAHDCAATRSPVADSSGSTKPTGSTDAAAHESIELAGEVRDDTGAATSDGDDIWSGTKGTLSQLPESTEEPADLLTDPSPRGSSEMAANLLAMRELANDSAREAIQSCEYRRYSALAVGQLIVASICLTASGATIALCPNKFGLETAAGAIGLFFGGSNFLRGTAKILNSMRLKRKLARNDQAGNVVEAASDQVEPDEE